MPELDVDLWSDGVLADPYPTYARLRALGPVLYDRAHDAYVLPRYHEVRTVLQDWETFSSAHGIALNDRANSLGGRGVLTSDPPVHDELRKVLSSQLVPREVARFAELLDTVARQLVDQALARPSFDVVADVARAYSLTVVADLCGLPADGREGLLAGAAAAFETLGPENDRCLAAWDGFADLMSVATTVAVPGRLVPGGWGDGIYAAADRGEIDRRACPGLMLAYLWAGMDTTANGIGSAVALFADHPDQWDLLRADRSLLASATAEILRIEPPGHRFTRCAQRECEIAGHPIPAGARVVVLVGSANRDDRRFPDPDRFDITRNPTDHLAFGRGIHRCVGAGLAQEEMRAVLSAFADRVPRFHVHAREQRPNNTLHGLERLVVTVAAPDAQVVPA
jgi:cytochrome P450